MRRGTSLLGGAIGRQGSDVRGGAMHGNMALHGRRRLVHTRCTAFRSAERSGAFSGAGGESGGGRLGAEGRNPARKMDASSSTRRRIRGVTLRPGDEIRIEGRPDGNDPAGIDYVEILPE
jgi:hypothetical protein